MLYNKTIAKRKEVGLMEKMLFILEFILCIVILLMLPIRIVLCAAKRKIINKVQSKGKGETKQWSC